MKLGALEKKVMDHIWKNYQDSSFTVRDVVEGLNKTEQTPYAYNTILTVMTHLFKKGVLTRTKKGKTCTYAMELSKGDVVAEASRDFFQRMQKEYGPVAIAHFANLVDEVDPQVLKAAKAALRKQH